MDLFDHVRVAQGYSRFRPRFHSQVIAQIKESLGLQGFLSRVLDVGCGTGLSTTPMAALGQTVIGVDRAREMVSHAERGPGIHYLVSTAEELPFLSGIFGAISVAGAINWIDRGRFLSEARRLLCAPGWLLIYDGAEMGAMVGNDGFGQWYREKYLARLPRLARDERGIEDSEAKGSGFTITNRTQYVLELPFALPGYVEFLLTQSNTTAAVDQNRESVDSIRCWLTETLPRFFKSREQRMLFGGYFWCLQRG